MSGQTYTLVLGDLEIGTVHQADADFPNVWGTFSPTPRIDRPEIREHVNHYIAYSREADRLMEEDGSAGGRYDAFVTQNERQFLDLIECDDWHLVDPSGKRHPILVPIFGVDGVVWRWNVV